MSDPYLYQGNDGGELSISGGVTEMREGLETAAYLSLFGGNEEDPGSIDSAVSWWGNLDETDRSRHMRSETQYLLATIPSTTGNLKRVREGCERDLAWLVEQAVASSVESTVRIIGPQKVEFSISIVVDDARFDYVFTRAWQARTQA